MLDNSLDRWPPRFTPSGNYLKTFMERFELEDIWRKKIPSTISYTWQNKSGSCQSQIDFGLVSKQLIDNSSVDILVTSLTDHKAVHIKMSLTQDYNCRASFWKLIISHLKHDFVT